MNHIPEHAACEVPSLEKQNVHAHSAAFRDGTTPSHDRGGSPHCILVVDDDRGIRQLCADALLNSGYRVDTAEDAVAAWQALQARSYHLLLTDNKMPMVSGIELVKKLRSVRMDLPVVLSSSAIPTEEIDRNPSLQLAATLPKPFTIAELLDTVKQVLTADSRNHPGNSVPMLAADAHRLTPIAR